MDYYLTDEESYPQGITLFYFKDNIFDDLCQECADHRNSKYAFAFNYLFIQN